MAQDLRKTLVVLSQIKTALEVGPWGVNAICLALESPHVSGLFSVEQIKTVLDKLESGKSVVSALATLDILSEYDQTLLQAGEDSASMDRAIEAIINQHMFIRSLGV